MSAQEEDDEDPHRQVPVQIRIPQSLKEEWREDAESEYGSFKNLITTAVHRERSDKYILEKEVSDVAETILASDEFDVDLSGLESEIEAIKDQLDAISSSVVREGDESMERGELTRIAAQAEAALISVPDEETMRELEIPIELPQDERAAITGYPEEIATFIGEEDVWKVHQALIWLEVEEDTSQVYSLIDDDGRRRFYKIDPTVDYESDWGAVDWEPSEDWDPWDKESEGDGLQ